MKILKIIFIVLLISLIFASGILLGKNLVNKSSPLSINKFSPTITPNFVSSIKIPLDETSIYNFGKISFPYEKSWRMYLPEGDINMTDYSIKSLCINPGTILPNAGLNCEVSIDDYLLSREHKTILNVNQFINFLSSQNQGQDITWPTPYINNFVNDKNISITKQVGPHALTGEIIEGYFFQYTDQANQLHFVIVYGDSVRIIANDVALKTFVNQIIKSVSVN